MVHNLVKQTRQWTQSKKDCLPKLLNVQYELHKTRTVTSHSHSNHSAYMQTCRYQMFPHYEEKWCHVVLYSGNNCCLHHNDRSVWYKSGRTKLAANRKLLTLAHPVFLVLLSTSFSIVHSPSHQKMEAGNFPQNVSTYLRNYTASHPRRQ